MRCPSRSAAFAHPHTDFDAEQPSVFIAVLDALCQRDAFRNDQLAPSCPAITWLGLPIDVRQNLGISLPAIAVPGERAVMGTLCRPLHRACNQSLADGAAGTGNDEATVAVLHEAAPAFSFISLLSSAVFFCTNDQNSSIST